MMDLLFDDSASQASSITLCYEDQSPESTFTNSISLDDEEDSFMLLTNMAPLIDLTELLSQDIENHPAFIENEESFSSMTVDLTADDHHQDEDVIIVSEQQSLHMRSSLSIREYGFYFVVGMSVWLRDMSFLRIESILRHISGKTFLRGRRLKRLDELGCEVPQWDELCWIVDQNNDEISTNVPLEQVKEIADISFTNQRQSRQRQPSRCLKFIRSNRHKFICRLKHVTFSKYEVTLQYLDFDECDDNFRVKPQDLRLNWRGETPKFGSFTAQPRQHARRLFDVESGEELYLPLDGTEMANSRLYAFGDGFCGAGGVSYGANQAGLHLKWSFDKDADAALTYRQNFPETLCETADIFDFLTNDPDDLRIDISHSSPPCQPWSPAHTTGGRDDDANSATIFSSWNLLSKTKPRVHTMEETSGLAELTDHKRTFDRLIHDFVELGYSVQYKILHCADYGIPQGRRRLVLIASGQVKDTSP
jgi:DNA (cytosine-5)-methyltransferase 1